MKLVNDVKDSTKVLRIYDEKYEYSFGYYNNNEWVDENRLVLSRWKKNDSTEFPNETELVLIDIKKGTETVLCDKETYGRNSFCYLVSRDKVYFLNKEDWLCSKDVNTGEITKIHKRVTMVNPDITADGKYLIAAITLNKDTAQETYACLRVNLETGKAEELFEKTFEKPMAYAGHKMICPTDEDKVFFCHEGNTHYVSNRLWLWTKDKGCYCLAKQRLNENGDLGDCFGHECWAPDGKGLYFIKYPCSPMKPTGICYVSTEKEQTDVLYGKYGYWHVCAAKNGRFLAADTTGRDNKQPEYSGVCLIDMETGEEKMLIKADITWKHPCHPHPKFNLDSSLLMYHELYNGNTCVNIIKIEDVID